ncbi:MAG: DUF4442 domain-containing protein [Marinirhabdus sp.]
MFFKLPAAYLTGVRVVSVSESSCTTKVRHRWINQNPFRSVFWAVQGMAAELSTGAMVMAKVRESGKPISMLVANNRASFSKKATGKITFVCNDGHKISGTIANTLTTGEGQTLWMKSVGTNSAGDVVSEFDFEWTLRARA